MLFDDTMHEPVVQFRAAIDGNRATACQRNRLH